MMIDRRYLLIPLFLSIAMTSGCGSEVTSDRQAPSEVTNGKPESSLATVTLSSDAVQRLGIKTTLMSVQIIGNSHAYSGEIAPAPGASSSITAPFAGRVVAPDSGLPTPGSKIENGDLVLNLQAVVTQTAGVYPAEELEVRNTELKTAEAALRRTTELLASKAASQEELERAQSDVARAKAAYHSAEARVDSMRSSSADAKASASIRAPLSGTLQSLAVGPGQIVSAGEPLFRVTSQAILQVRVAIFPGDAENITDGNASVTKLGGRSANSISALRVNGAPSASSNASTIDIYYQIDDPNALFRTGERVEISVPYGAQSERLVVPYSAIFTDIYGGNWVYEEMTDSSFSRRRVVIDFLSGDLAVLVAGPKVGNPIVTVGVAELAGTEFGIGK